MTCFVTLYAALVCASEQEHIEDPHEQERMIKLQCTQGQNYSGNLKESRKNKYSVQTVLLRTVIVIIVTSGIVIHIINQL